MKTCTKCKEYKPLKDFYNRTRSKDGKAYQCKECESKDAKLWRDKNKDRHHTNYNKWYLDNFKRVSEYKKSHSLEFPELVAKYRKRQEEREPEKTKARMKVRGWVGHGYIIKPKFCSICGNGGIIHGHHEDYSKPLEVDWLCENCHVQIHWK
jgi:ribosomal protein S27AE